MYTARKLINMILNKEHASYCPRGRTTPMICVSGCVCWTHEATKYISNLKPKNNTTVSKKRELKVHLSGIACGQNKPSRVDTTVYNFVTCQHCKKIIDHNKLISSTDVQYSI